MRTLVNFLMVIAFAIGSVNAQNIPADSIEYSNPECGTNNGVIIVKGYSNVSITKDGVIISSSQSSYDLYEGTYCIYVEENGIILSSVVNLISSPAPYMIIPTELSVKKGELLSINIQGSLSLIEIVNNNEDLIGNSNIFINSPMGTATFKVRPTNTKQYTFMATSLSNGCISVSTVLVTVN